MLDDTNSYRLTHKWNKTFLKIVGGIIPILYMFCFILECFRFIGDYGYKGSNPLLSDLFPRVGMVLYV